MYIHIYYIHIHTAYKYVHLCINKDISHIYNIYIYIYIYIYKFTKFATSNDNRKNGCMKSIMKEIKQLITK